MTTAAHALPDEAVTPAVTVATADDLFNIDDIKIEKVHVDVWNKDVYVKSLTGKNRDAWLVAIQPTELPNKAVVRSTNNTAKLLVKAICDESGTLLFKDSDADRLGNKNASALEQIAAVVLRISGMSNEALAEAEGNSDDTPSDSSTSS